MRQGKQFYIQHDTEHLPIWSQPHFVNAVAGSKWDCRFIVEKEEIVAVWIYGETKKLGLRSMNFPTFLKYNGPFFSATTNPERYDDLAMELYSSLPSFIKMNMEFQPGLHEHIPRLITVLKERAFAQKVRQTYVWNVSDTGQDLLSQMDGNYRRMINKHKSACVLKLASLSEAEDMYSFHAQWVDDLSKHGVSEDRFRSVIESIYKADCGGVLELIYEGTKIASVLLVFSRSSVYYLLSVNNKKYNKIYPAVLMANEIANFVRQKQIGEIDFLGSDLEAISRVWRKLGAEKKEYLYLNKNFILPF